MQIVDVDDKLAIHAESIPLEKGGFQRELDERRLSKMATNLITGSICPPIIIAKIEGKMLVLDGQHRLAAWKRQPFPLKAMIINLKDKKEAAKAFVTINTTQKRVRRNLVLQLGDDAWSVEVRRLAKEFKISIMQADAALNGAQGGRSKSIGDNSPLDKQRTGLIEIVLSTWIRDKRFQDEEGCFSKPGTLMFVCRMVRDMRTEAAIIAFLKNMLTLDYGRTSALTHVCGRQSISQREMIKIVNKELDARLK